MNKAEIIKQVAETIRVERFRKRLSQEKLAEMAGISTKYLNSIENEKVNPSITIVVQLCKALDIELNQLITK